ncbi:MAG: hypothetical protein KDC33_00940 [Thermoleophilia bacterium]|nr:hypothetical protein [Thermoleophilia bacterium]
MVDTRFPNRWFASNPQAIPNHGKQLHPWSDDLPKDWRSALQEHEHKPEPVADAADDQELDG